MKRARRSIAKKGLKLEIAHAGHRRDEKATITIGDLIAELTDNARRHVSDEKELYEVVAYLLETRLSQRHRSRYFWQLCARIYIPAVLKSLGAKTQITRAAMKHRSSRDARTEILPFRKKEKK